MNRAQVGALEDTIDSIALRDIDTALEHARFLPSSCDRVTRALRRKAGPDWETAKAAAELLVAKHRPLVWDDGCS